jgi:hypothetical protein
MEARQEENRRKGEIMAQGAKSGVNPDCITRWMGIDSPSSLCGVMRDSHPIHRPDRPNQC